MNWRTTLNTVERVGWRLVPGVVIAAGAVGLVAAIANDDRDQAVIAAVLLLTWAVIRLAGMVNRLTIVQRSLAQRVTTLISMVQRDQQLWLLPPDDDADELKDIIRRSIDQEES